MKDKYYTPEIEELYPGFEIRLCTEKEIKPFIVSSGLIEGMVYDLTAVKGGVIYNGKDRGKRMSDREVEWRNNHIKVKYLDQEDIESLGWIYSSTRKEWEIWTKNRDLYYGIKEQHVDGKYDIFFIQTNKEIHIPTILFKGTIKNKSELKKLMKQLGIDVISKDNDREQKEH